MVACPLANPCPNIEKRKTERNHSTKFYYETVLPTLHVKLIEQRNL